MMSASLGARSRAVALASPVVYPPPQAIAPSARRAKRLRFPLLNGCRVAIVRFSFQRLHSRWRSSRPARRRSASPLGVRLRLTRGDSSPAEGTRFPVRIASPRTTWFPAAPRAVRRANPCSACGLCAVVTPDGARHCRWAAGGLRARVVAVGMGGVLRGRRSAPHATHADPKT